MVFPAVNSFKGEVAPPDHLGSIPKRMANLIYKCLHILPPSKGKQPLNLYAVYTIPSLVWYTGTPKFFPKPRIWSLTHLEGFRSRLSHASI